MEFLLKLCFSSYSSSNNNTYYVMGPLCFVPLGFMPIGVSARNKGNLLQALKKCCVVMTKLSRSASWEIIQFMGFGQSRKLPTGSHS